MAALRAALQADGPAAKAVAITQPQAVTGLGGIGKTRLAVEYAWRYGAGYSAVLFVGADSPERLWANLAQAGGPRLPGTNGALGIAGWEVGQTQEQQLGLVFRWLQDPTNETWLMILDNVDADEAAAVVQKDLLHHLDKGCVLITSRRVNLGAEVTSDALDTMRVRDARDYLLANTPGRAPSNDDPAHALDLAIALAGLNKKDEEEARKEPETVRGGLPLALEQAAAYIDKHGMTFAGYLKEWMDEAERLKLLRAHDEERVLDYKDSVAVSFMKTWEQLGAAPRALLRLCAFLAPDPIPCALFEDHEEEFDAAVKLICDECPDSDHAPMKPQQAIADARVYSLVTRDEKDITVHRMVQDVVRAHIPEDRRREWLAQALEVVNAHVPLESDDVRTWPALEPLRPHVEAVLQSADAAGITEPTARLMSQLGIFHKAKGLYAKAEPYCRRALALCEGARDPQNPAVATCLNNLAMVLHDINRLREAESLMRRALEINEATCGPKHPNVATVLNNLALLLRASDRHAEAEPLLRRALEIDEAALGARHPDVARDLSNLALLLHDAGRLDDAESLLRRVLQIDEAASVPGHPDGAIHLNNLAMLLRDTKRLASAELLMRRALEMHEATLGRNHHAVAIDLGNLGSLLQAQGNPAEGKRLLERALAIFEQSFDADHPYVVETKRRLATFEDS